jgi:hypothetical protein
LNAKKRNSLALPVVVGNHSNGKGMVKLLVPALHERGRQKQWRKGK